MSRDKAETVSKRWNIHLRENLKADHYPKKNTSCKQQFVVQKEYLSSSVSIGYLQFLFRGQKWRLGGVVLGCWSTVLILPLLCDASDSLTPVCTKHCWVRSCMFPKQRQHLQQSMCVHIGIHLDNHRTALWGQTQGSHQHILSLQQHIQQDIYRVILPLLQPSSFLFAVQKPL